MANQKPDITSRIEVFERFCALGGEVAEHFQRHEAADCFCGSNPASASEAFSDFFRYSEKVLTFIEAAVRQRIVAQDPPVEGRADRHKPEELTS